MPTLTLVALLLASCAAGTAPATATSAPTATSTPPAAAPATTAGTAAATTPGDATALPDGTATHARGFLLVDPSGAWLCAALAESLPPRCAGPDLPLAGLDPDAVVGLTTAGSPPVTWNDVPVTLAGTVAGGVLTVTGVDQTVFAAFDGDIRVRLALPPEPLVSGAPVTWLLDLTNLGTAPLALEFRTGQDADVLLFRGDAEVYRWSADLLFTQAVRDLELAPGERRGVALAGPLRVGPGTYRVVARFVAPAVADLAAAGNVTVTE